MKRAAIVPHHQIADPPAMLVNEAWLGCKNGQLFEKGATLVCGPSDDVRRMRSEIERASFRAGMKSHHRLANRRQCGALVVGELRVTDKASRMKDRVLGEERGDPFPGYLVQGFIRGTEIGELRLASVGGTISRADKSENLAGTRLNELSVCQSLFASSIIRHRSEAALILLFSSRFEISASSLRRRCLRSLRILPIGVSSSPEQAAEGDLMLVVDHLLAKHEHRMAIERRRDLVDGCPIGQIA